MNPEGVKERVEETESSLAEKVLLRVLILSPLLLAVGFFSYLLLKPADLKNSKQIPRLQMGQLAPDFSFPDLEGRKVRLSSLRGRVVLLNIWATWCPTCIEEMPSLQKLHESFQDRDLAVVSVSIDVLGEQVVAPFMKKYGLSFPALLDPRGQIKKAYTTTGVPESFIIDRQGVVVHKVIGPRNWIEPTTLSFFEEMIKRSS
ncbi:MAG: TlpA family protein disulfide reductase [Nitrospinae bacterium]|nr:TlpA family protein disulfide reductase [Nitrospinota bacterium]